MAWLLEMVHNQDWSQELNKEVVILSMELDIGVEIDLGGILVVKGRTNADEGDKTDGFLIKLNEMNFVGNDQAFDSCDIVEVFKIYVMFWRRSVFIVN